MRSWRPKEIKAFRNRLKLSRKAFGDLLGVSRIHIYYLEGGERKTSKTLRLLLNSLKRENGKEEKEKYGKRNL
jgi:DNA-binding transcriptional regulator YiaG